MDFLRDHLPGIGLGIALLVCLGLVLTIQYADSRRFTPPQPGVASKVSEDVYDDGKDTVMIRLSQRRLDADSSIFNLMAMKSTWQAANPTKKLLSIDVIPGDCGQANGYTCVHGFLILYQAE
jgi:hypothetical protein